MLFCLLAATIFAATTANDGNWSSTNTWTGGVLPADSETITINHNVIYDYDNSAMTNGYGAITVSAGKSITASTTAGSYYLKLAGILSNYGTLQAGTESVRYPSNCLFTIYLNGNYYIYNMNATAKTYFWCYDPPIKYMRLISATPKVITGITQATSCVVTCVGHGLSVNNLIYLVNIGGMTEIADVRLRVHTVVDADHIIVKWVDTGYAVDSTELTAYTSGGLLCPEVAEAQGQTQIEVDQDASSDPEWTRAGAIVHINNVNRAANSESFILSGVSSTYLTLPTGLAASKLSSSLAVLATRNIRIRTAAAQVSYGCIRGGTSCRYDCEFKPTNSATPSIQGNSNSVMGGVVSYGATAFADSVGCTMSGVVTGNASCTTAGCSDCIISGLSTGCAYAIYSGYRNKITGVVIGNTQAASYGNNNIFVNASIRGCQYAEYQSSYGLNSGIIKDTGSSFSSLVESTFTGIIITGSTGATGYGSVIFDSKIYGCGHGVAGSGLILSNVKFFNCNDDIFWGSGVANNCYLSSPVENLNFASNQYQNPYNYFESFDHDQIAGAFRSWTLGGVTSSTLTDPPAGRVRSYQSVMASATYPTWYQRRINVEAGRTLYLRVWGKADSGTTFYAQLVLPTADPLITGTGTGVWQQVMTADGAWHEYVTSWRNTATYPVTINARFLAYKASGNAYSDCQWSFDRPPVRR